MRSGSSCAMAGPDAASPAARVNDTKVFMSFSSLNGCLVSPTSRRSLFLLMKLQRDRPDDQQTEDHLLDKKACAGLDQPVFQHPDQVDAEQGADHGRTSAKQVGAPEDDS